jgi:hypothetical protein
LEGRFPKPEQKFYNGSSKRKDDKEEVYRCSEERDLS